MKLWKRNAVVLAIVAFVCVAVYLNWSYGQEATADAGGKKLGEATLVDNTVEDPLLVGDGQGEGGAEPTTGYFSAARLNRQQARDSAIGLLQQAAGDEKAPQTSVDEANAAIQTMAAQTVAEAQMENLITAKGYADCVVFLSDNSISVVVAATETGLTEADTARITEIVMEQSGLTASEIKIIEANQ